MIVNVLTKSISKKSSNPLNTIYIYIYIGAILKNLFIRKRKANYYIDGFKLIESG